MTRQTGAQDSRAREPVMPGRTRPCRRPATLRSRRPFHSWQIALVISNIAFTLCLTAEHIILLQLTYVRAF
jgi:hypothetical protein